MRGAITSTSTLALAALATWPSVTAAGGEAPGLFAPFSGSGVSDVSIEQGGWQVEYDDEAPLVLDLFEEDCLRHGAVPDMRRFFPGREEFKVQLPTA